jgi:hypothetical protein
MVSRGSSAQRYVIAPVMNLRTALGIEGPGIRSMPVPCRYTACQATASLPVVVALRGKRFPRISVCATVT